MMTSTLMILITLHLLMGGLDTLYHHELKEKLAWKPSQQVELKLHGIRNIFYALIYISFGVLIPSGFWAFILIGIVVTEVLVTFADFIEEDQSRELPGTERILHTILGVNFGAILCLLVPKLWSLSTLEASLAIHWQGWWSILCLTAGLLAMIFAIRDIAASARLKRIAANKKTDLLGVCATPKSVLVTGATGFVGTRLIEALQSAGHEVIALTRNHHNASGLAAPITLITSLEQLSSQTVIDVIINLAGEKTAARWTPAHMDKMLNSRLRCTHDLVSLIKRLEQKPEVLISASASSIYGINSSGETHEHEACVADGSFGQSLCKLWEEAAMTAKDHGVRVVQLRIGMVLDPAGGSLSEMLVPTQLGGGAIFGSGQQMMSWISRDDLVRLIGHTIINKQLNGPVNAVSPTPVSNQEFVTTLARCLNRPTLIRIPEFIFTRLVGGFGKEVLLANHCLLPEKALESGFQFIHPQLKPALEDLLQPRKSRVAKQELNLEHE